MKKTEHNLQVAIVNYLRLQYKNVLFWAIPNGGSRNVIEATNMKREGVLRGVPDVFIAQPNRIYHGLFLELKSKSPFRKDSIVILKNEHLQEQHEMITRLNGLGYYAAFVWSFEQAKRIIDEYLGEAK